LLPLTGWCPGCLLAGPLISPTLVCKTDGPRSLTDQLKDSTQTQYWVWASQKSQG
jgi:hypothetical protein